MEAPERIWIAPVHGATRPDDFYLIDPEYRNGRGVEYIRADLLDAHIGAVLEGWKSRIENLWITADNDREEGYDEGLQAVLEELPFVRPDAQQAIERVRREARVEALKQAADAVDRIGPRVTGDAIRALIADALEGEK